MLAPLLLAAALAHAAPMKVAVDSSVTPLPDKPEHERPNPCAGVSFEGDFARKKSRHCAGLTDVKFQPKVEALAWAGDSDWEHSTRLWLESAKVQFALQLEMRVSALFDEDSCPYKATVEHEKGHWNDALAAHKLEAAALERDLAAANLPTRESPLRVKLGTAQRVAQEKTDAVDAIVAARQKALWKRLQAAIAKRDSPYNYQRHDKAKCPDAEWRDLGF